MALAKQSAFDDPPIQILLIDDDEDSYVLTRDLLAEVTSQRYVLDWAKTAQSGVAAMEAGNFDVALVDFYLGAHNGDKVIAELRRRKSTVPLILLTSEDLLQNDIAVMEAGADEFLIKGTLSPAVLERMIRYSIERRANSAAIQASEERFRELFESNLDAVFVTGPSGRILAANPAAEALFRLKEAELMARSRMALLADEDPDITQQLDARLQAGAFRDEIVFRRGDRSTFTGEVTVAPGNDLPGARTSMIIRDLSARRSTERRAATTERRLRRIETGGPYVAVAAALGIVLIALFVSVLAALALAGGVIIAQYWLRHTSTKLRTLAYTSLAEWRENAVDARRGLSRFAEYLQVDPESGLGTKLSMQRAVERQICSYRRTGETFTLVLVEIADPETPRTELQPPIVQSASELLSGATTIEECVSRMNANTFGVLLPGRDFGHSAEFIERFRQRMGNKLRGDKVRLRIIAGRAEMADGIGNFAQLLQKATDDLEHYDRDLAFQISQFKGAVRHPEVA